ncbi:MAG TPA: glycoside hydrolase family 5 protein [Polyangiaceae bacterium]|jgi:endoglucanase|nr:glycoside hydrolase family 5 protein [Polyangiaceae bacterium]
MNKLALLVALSPCLVAACATTKTDGKATQAGGSTGAVAVASPASAPGAAMGTGGASTQMPSGAPALPAVPPPATATAFAKLPYRGLSLAGAEFGASIGGTFDGNGLGQIPESYYYPDKDWDNPNEYPGGYAKNAFPFFRSRGMNTFRLPFRWERLQRSLYADFDATEWTDLKLTVHDMEAAGAFVLLDVHNYVRYALPAKVKSGALADTIGTPAVPNAAFADLWRRLAEQYKNDPNILFGLMNEPFQVTQSNQWLDAANAAIAAIRATGAKNLVLVAGNEFDDAKRWPDISDMLKDIKDPAGNFAYEVHVYPDTSGNGSGNSCPDTKSASKGLQPFTEWARAHHARGFLGEFSAGTDIHADANCMAAVDDELSYLEKNSDVFIGWTYWAGGQGFRSDSPMENSVVNHRNSPQMDVLVKHLK